MSSPAGDPLDLTGEWSGVYNYPRGLPPVAFAASISERGGGLTGQVTETTLKGARVAFLEGRRVGPGVTWLKCYEHRDVKHDVHYEGVVSADGEEISGRWSIVGAWSGTFLMVRQARAAAGTERRARADARA